jgi:hypothetical protein
VKIGARSVDDAALAILLKGDLDAILAQMVERRRVILMCDRKGMMHTAVILGPRIDRRVALHKDETRAGRIEKRHRAAPHGREMPAADNLRVEARAALNIANRNAEMHNRLDCGHRTPP